MFSGIHRSHGLHSLLTSGAFLMHTLHLIQLTKLLLLHFKDLLTFTYVCTYVLRFPPYKIMYCSLNLEY